MSGQIEMRIAYHLFSDSGRLIISFDKPIDEALAVKKAAHALLDIFIEVVQSEETIITNKEPHDSEQP